MQWSFKKYSACGNDFILFDNRQKLFPFSQPGLIQQLCHRQRGIGANGVLLLENTEHADFCMRIFNSDGSEAEMCGNGLRCFTQWLMSLGFNPSHFRIEVMGHVFITSKIKDAICIEMGRPRQVHYNISLSLANQELILHFLDTGVPHAILFMEEIDQINLIELGSYIRHHPLWQPQGTNVTIAQQIDVQKVKIRTYERGVEGETLACGTGATAAALAAAYQYKLASPIMIQTRSGEELKIEFSLQQQDFFHVTLSGQADYVFQGEINLLEIARSQKLKNRI